MKKFYTINITCFHQDKKKNWLDTKLKFRWRLPLNFNMLWEELNASNPSYRFDLEIKRGKYSRYKSNAPLSALATTAITFYKEAFVENIFSAMPFFSYLKNKSKKAGVGK